MKNHHTHYLATTNLPATSGNASDIQAAYKAAEARRLAAGKPSFGIRPMTAAQRAERRNNQLKAQ